MLECPNCGSINVKPIDVGYVCRACYHAWVVKERYLADLYRKKGKSDA